MFVGKIRKSLVCYAGENEMALGSNSLVNIRNLSGL